MVCSASRPLSLRDIHIWVIQLEAQASWLQQLFKMSRSLPYIHLLQGDENEGQPISSVELDEGCCEKPLLNMFYRSPSKIQILCDKCSDAIRCSQVATKQCSDWFSSNYRTLDEIERDERSVVTGDSSVEFIDNRTSLRVSRQTFLTALERLQLRIPILLRYQKILQYVACSK